MATDYTIVRGEDQTLPEVPGHGEGWTGSWVVVCRREVLGVYWGGMTLQ